MSMIRKLPLAGKIASMTPFDRRPAGEMPRTEHYYVLLNVTARDTRGDVAHVELELSTAQIRQILRSLPSKAVADLLSPRDVARVKGTFDQEFPNG